MFALFYFFASVMQIYLFPFVTACTLRICVFILNAYLFLTISYDDIIYDSLVSFELSYVYNYPHYIEFRNVRIFFENLK